MFKFSKITTIYNKEGLILSEDFDNRVICDNIANKIESHYRLYPNPNVSITTNHHGGKLMSIEISILDKLPQYQHEKLTTLRITRMEDEDDK